MTLSPGTRLGGYEILALLGAGGMGGVYRATDSKLGRDVAIKVLAAEFARAARALASLNHPNFAAGPLPARNSLQICREFPVALEAAHEKGIVHRDLKDFGLNWFEELQGRNRR